MKLLIGLLLIVVSASTAAAQVSAAEAQRRLAERQAAARAATTQSTTLTTAQVQAIQDRAKSLEAEVANLRTQIGAKQAENFSLKQRVATLEGQLTTLQAQLTNATAATSAPQAPTAPAVAEPPAARQTSAPAPRAVGMFGDAEVAITSYGVGKVPLKYLRDDTASENELLFIKLSITNRSGTKKLDYDPWMGRSVSFERDYATARDNFGNVLKRIDFGIGLEIVGAVKYTESLYPGKSLQDVLVFEKPVSGATSVKIEFPQKNLGGTGGPVSIELPLAK